MPDLPVPYPTCPALGGPNLDQLDATSISNALRAIASDHPDAGRRLRIEGLPAPGLPEARRRV